jgi:hypothetical protein
MVSPGRLSRNAPITAVISFDRHPLPKDGQSDSLAPHGASATAVGPTPASHCPLAIGHPLLYPEAQL